MTLRITRIGKRFSSPCAFRFPRLSSTGNSKPFDPAKLSIVRLKFDRTPIYKICISAIGFGKQ